MIPGVMDLVIYALEYFEFPESNMLAEWRTSAGNAWIDAFNIVLYLYFIIHGFIFYDSLKKEIPTPITEILVYILMIIPSYVLLYNGFFMGWGIGDDFTGIGKSIGVVLIIAVLVLGEFVVLVFATPIGYHSMQDYESGDMGLFHLGISLIVNPILLLVLIFVLIFEKDQNTIGFSITLFMSIGFFVTIALTTLFFLILSLPQYLELSAKARDLGFSNVNQWIACRLDGFEDKELWDLAKQEGFTSKSEWLESQDKTVDTQHEELLDLDVKPAINQTEGSTKETLSTGPITPPKRDHIQLDKAQELGFYSEDEMLKALRAGCNNKAAYDFIRSKNFVTVEAMVIFWVSQRDLLREYEEFVMSVINTIDTIDSEKELQDIDERIGDIYREIEAISTKETGIINQIKIDANLDFVDLDDTTLDYFQNELITTIDIPLETVKSKINQRIRWLSTHRP